ncbi:MAG: hypothetical protein CMJ66_08475 [Planctomycetaceae bacterium]|nr:hypothetical protein [Planctomycetaceae bacterium]
MVDQDAAGAGERRCLPAAREIILLFQSPSSPSLDSKSRNHEFMKEDPRPFTDPTKALIAFRSLLASRR